MSIEEKYDEIRQLIIIGKEKGYLLYDEVNEVLPADLTSSQDLDDLFNIFGHAGIEVVDSEQKYLGEKAVDRRSEGASDADNTVPPTGVDKTSDPVRMYLREMGRVPLLKREGEVEIAKRIERGKLAVIRSISRTPTNARIIVRLGEQLRSGERTIRELVVFKDEELGDNRIDDRGRQILRQIDASRPSAPRSRSTRRDSRRSPSATGASIVNSGGGPPGRESVCLSSLAESNSPPP